MLHTDALNLGYCFTHEEATRVYGLYILFNYGHKATTSQSLVLFNQEHSAHISPRTNKLSGRNKRGDSMQ